MTSATSETTHGFSLIREREIRVPRQNSLGAEIFVSVESGEERGLFAISHLNPLKTRIALKIRFDPPITKSAYSAEAKAVIAKLKDRRALTAIRCKQSTEVVTNARAIVRALEQACGAGRNNDICIDISAMPKAYFLSILGWAFKSKGLARIKFVYSPGKFPHLMSGNSHYPGSFTEGPWSLQLVPYLEGHTSTSPDKQVVAFVGADLDRTEEVLRPYDEYSRSVIYPMNLGKAHSEENLVKVREELANRFGLKVTNVAVCNRASVVDPLLKLKDAFTKVSTDGVIFPFATKLTALAGGIYALSSTSKSIYVRVPKRYIPMEVPASGSLVVVEVIDLTHRDAGSYC